MRPRGGQHGKARELVNTACTDKPAVRWLCQTALQQPHFINRQRIRLKLEEALLTTLQAMPGALDWALVTAVAAPHVLYAAVWLLPDAWRSVFRRRPVEAFQFAAAVGKGARPLQQPAGVVSAALRGVLC